MSRRLTSAATVAVGDELLEGRHPDLNSAVIAAALGELGVATRAMHVVGDSEEELAALFAELCGRDSLVVATGGLGPTLDDLTRQAAARAAGVELETCAETARALEERYGRAGAPFPASNLRQALLPAGAESLPNRAGTAPGFLLPVGDALLAALPGPPREMVPMLEGELLPTLPSAFASFAASVAIQGNWAAVGAPGQSTVTTNNGVVYVYRQSGGSWSLHTVLTADDANSYAEFGRSVEVGYNRVLVGAPYANGPQQLSGAVYSFRWDGIEWFQNDKLTAPGGETGDNLGFDVAAYGGRLVAGAKYADGGGKAYVFDEVHLSLYPFPDWYYWEHEATLVPADSANAGRFGSAVSMAYGTAGVTAVIGDEKSDQHVPGAGSAHVFVASGTTWTETAELVSLELQTSEEFGASVAHDGSHVLVGAPEGVSAAGNYAGEVFSFTLENKPLQVDTVSVSVSEGGTQTMTIDAGPEHAGKLYWVLGTLSGTSPGFELLGAHLPLNPDFYYNFTLQHPSLFPLVDTVGFLDGANGTATAAFTQPSDGKPSVVGLLMHHAYIVLDAGSIDFVSNPMPLEFTQ